MENQYTGYDGLQNVLSLALAQAAAGKGAERHARERAFEDQPIMMISEMLQTPDGLRYQAIKKIQESQRMPTDRAVQELLGAINYIAATIIYIKRHAEAAETEPNAYQSAGTC